MKSGLFDDATLQSPEVLEQVMEFISSGSSSATDLNTEPDVDIEDNNTFDVSLQRLFITVKKLQVYIETYIHLTIKDLVNV